MANKLTLSIDKNIAQKAKTYAKKQGRSLSGLIEDYLKLLTAEEKNRANPNNATPISDNLFGVLKDKMPIDSDYKKVVGDELLKKYLS